MPNLPITKEELSGAAGALRSWLTNSLETSAKNLPAVRSVLPQATKVQLNTLSAPKFIQEAVRSHVPAIPAGPTPEQAAMGLQDPSRRAFMQKTGTSAAMHAVGLSPLGAIAKGLSQGVPEVVKAVKAAAPVDVGAKLADWYINALHDAGVDHHGLLDDFVPNRGSEPSVLKMHEDTINAMNEGEVPPSLSEYLGIKSIKDLARHADIPEAELTKHLHNRLEGINTSGTSVPDILDDMFGEHVVSTANHKDILEDGGPDEARESTSLGDEDIHTEHALDNLTNDNFNEDGDKVDFAADFSDHYLDSATQHEFPLAHKILGERGLDDYTRKATAWPDVAEQAFPDSGDFYDMASPHYDAEMEARDLDPGD